MEQSSSKGIVVEVQDLLTPAAIIVGSLIISVAIILAPGRNTVTTVSDTGNNNAAVAGVGDNNADAYPSEPEDPFPATNTTIDDDAFKGDKSTAKVAIIEFTDYQCPFCQRHFTNTYPDIMANYVETGEAIYVSRDFPLAFHAQASIASQAAECAREQGNDDTYFAAHDAIFELDSFTSSEEIYGAMETVKGVDIDELTKCVEDEKYADEVNADMQDGQSAGISGTPGFVVGVLSEDGSVEGVRIAGAYPYSDFESIIEEMLAK